MNVIGSGGGVGGNGKVMVPFPGLGGFTGVLRESILTQRKLTKRSVRHTKANMSTVSAPYFPPFKRRLCIIPGPGLKSEIEKIK